MKSNMELEMFIQIDEKVLWEYSTLPLFYLTKIARKMPNSKMGRSIDWWPADAIVCVAYLLLIKSLSLCISLATAEKNETTIPYRWLKCSVKRVFILQWYHHTGRCIENVILPIAFLSLMSGPCNTDFTISRSCLSAWNMMMFLHCYNFLKHCFSWRSSLKIQWSN